MLPRARVQADEVAPRCSRRTSNCQTEAVSSSLEKRPARRLIGRRHCESRRARPADCDRRFVHVVSRTSARSTRHDASSDGVSTENADCWHGSNAIHWMASARSPSARHSAPRFCSSTEESFGTVARRVGLRARQAGVRARGLDSCNNCRQCVDRDCKVLPGLRDGLHPVPGWHVRITSMRERPLRRFDVPTGTRLRSLKDGTRRCR
jgi:hypothetical protein